MASKRVIAICQSGGDFVKTRDGVLSYSGGEAFAVGIDEQTQLSGFKEEVAEMFSCSVDTVLMKYLLPSNKKTLITIAKDRDIQRLVNFLKDGDTVDVFVMTEEVAAARNTQEEALARNAQEAAATAAREAQEAAAARDAQEAAAAAAHNAQQEVANYNTQEAAAAQNVSDMSGSRSCVTTVSEAEIPVAASVAEAVIDTDMINDINMDVDVLNLTPLNAIPFGSTDAMVKHRRAALQWENVITGIDQRFNNVGEFREALHKYSVAHGFAYKYKKNDNNRVSVRCKADGCPFRIYASRLSTTQLICVKKFNPVHTCDGTSVSIGYQASKGWVKSIIKEKLGIAPNYKPKDIVEDIKREYGIQLNYSQARRAKRLVREQLQGSFKDAYSQLPYFCEKIKETNPGSIATFTTKEDSTFLGLFVSFHASLSGFQQACRPLIFLDSTPLFSKYQGTLLAATAADADDGVFPVAFAIVDADTEDNWRWFLVELRSAISASEQITFVADFQNGLKRLLPEIFENCYHSYCLRHLAEKLLRDLRGQFAHEARRFMLNDFYSAASAPKLEEFQRCTENIKGISPDVFNWVMQSEPEHWANAFFPGARYNHMTSNFGQEFYCWVSEAHDFPITQIIDELRGKMMEAMYSRRVESIQWMAKLTPSKEEQLHRDTAAARSLQVVLSHGSIFEVQGESVDIVDIEHWDCSCKEWQLSGLPCSHAIAVFLWIGRSHYDVCSRYFTTETFRLTYAESINPVPNIDRPLDFESDQAMVLVTPPPPQRQLGRPKTKQTETRDILKRQLQCSKCKGHGHNKKTCKVL